MNHRHNPLSLMAQLFAALFGINRGMKPERIGEEVRDFLGWVLRVKKDAASFRLPDLDTLVEGLRIIHGLFQSVGWSDTASTVKTVTVELPDTEVADTDDENDMPV